MPSVILYTRSWCPYCVRAKSVLDRYGVRYEEIDVEQDPAAEREMLERSRGRRTVPQIFIGDRHVGGSDELVALHRSGELARLLEVEPA